MTAIRPKNAPRVTAVTAGDTLLLDGATVRSILTDDFLAGVLAQGTRVITAAGPLIPALTDLVLIIKQTVGAPFVVNIDWSVRNKPLRIVDGKGDALTNNITITPTAGQSQLGTVNYSYVIDSNGGSITLTPLPDHTGAF